MNLYYDASVGFYIEKLRQMSSLTHDLILELLDHYHVYGIKDLTLEQVELFYTMKISRHKS